jgi:RND superfamily putative drug exporter
MILVPGLMLLTGKANWALPHTLDRLLPHLNVEGSVHDEPHATKAPHTIRARRLDPNPAEGST